MDISALNRHFNINTKQAGSSEALQAKQGMPNASRPIQIPLPAAVTNAAQLQNMLSDALENAGFKITPENIDMLLALLDNEMPLNKESIVKLNQAMKMMGGDVQKAMFFLKNDMSPSPANADTLNKLLSQDFKLPEQIGKLAEAISEMPNSPEKANLIKIISGGQVSSGSNAEKTATNADSNIKQQFSSGITSDGAKPSDVAAVRQGLDDLLKNISQKDLQNIPNPAGQTSTPIAQKNAVNNSAEAAALNSRLIHENPAEAESTKFLQNLIMNDLENNTLTIGKLSEHIKNALKSLPQNNTAKVDGGILELTPELTSKVLKQVFENEPKTLKKLIQTISDTPEIEMTNNRNSAVPKQVNEVSQIKEVLFQKFSINPKSADRGEIDEALSELKKAVVLSKQAIPNEADNQNLQKVSEILDNIQKNIDFSNQMKNSIYIQIPVVIDQDKSKANAELFIFKDKRKKSKSSGNASALLALDLLELGHVETYIVKNNKGITCQFRLPGENTESIIKNNITSLSDMLSNYGFNLTSVSYKKTDDPFTLIDTEPEQDNIPDNNTAPGKRKLFFDIHV